MVDRYLDDDVPFPGASAVQFTVFFHHDDLSFLLHLLHVLLHLVENAAIFLLRYTHKLDKTTRKKNKTQAAVREKSGPNLTAEKKKK